MKEPASLPPHMRQMQFKEPSHESCNDAHVLQVKCNPEHIAEHLIQWFTTVTISGI